MCVCLCVCVCVCETAQALTCHVYSLSTEGALSLFAGVLVSYSVCLSVYWCLSVSLTAEALAYSVCNLSMQGAFSLFTDTLVSVFRSPHLSPGHKGRLGTADDFTTSFLHFPVLHCLQGLGEL